MLSESKQEDMKYELNTLHKLESYATYVNKKITRLLACIRYIGYNIPEGASPTVQKSYELLASIVRIQQPEVVATHISYLAHAETKIRGALVFETSESGEVSYAWTHGSPLECKIRLGQTKDTFDNSIKQVTNKIVHRVTNCFPVKKLERDFICMICLGTSCGSTSAYRAFPCKHAIHTECLMLAITHQITTSESEDFPGYQCPMCRAQLL
jgi:hypothetical protein